MNTILAYLIPQKKTITYITDTDAITSMPYMK